MMGRSANIVETRRRANKAVLNWWMSNLPRTLLLVFLLAAMLIPVKVFAHTPELWLSVPPRADFPLIFRKPEEWARVLSATDAFMLQSSYVEKASSSDLVQIFRFLEDHKIKLALEAPMLQSSLDGCGTGIEGYKPPGYMKRVFGRIFALGGHLEYVAMDEPLWFGHFASRERGAHRPCQLPIPDVAANVAHAVAELKALFPQVRIGDEETIRSPQIDQAVTAAYADDVQSWLDTFHSATQTKIEFINWDILWFPLADVAADQANKRYWQAELLELHRLGDHYGLRTGVFFNGNPAEQSALDWNAHAVERYFDIEGHHPIPIGIAVFATWMRFPGKALPEADASAMMNVVLRCIQGSARPF